MVVDNKNKEYLITNILVLLVVVMPFNPIILAPLVLGLLLVVFLAIGDKKQKRSYIKRYKIGLLTPLYGLFGVLGMFYSFQKGISYDRVSFLIPLIVIPLLLICLNIHLNKLIIIKKAFIYACFVFCLLAFTTLFYNYVVNFQHRLNYNFIQRSMYHYHYPYDVLYVNSAVIFLLFSNFRPIFKGVVYVVFFIFIILSGVRMGLVCFVLISFSFAICNYKSFINIKSLIGLVIGIILAIVLITSSRYVNDKFFDSIEKLGLNISGQVSDIGAKYHDISIRNKLWRSSVEALNGHELLGYGPKGSRDALNRVYEKNTYNNILNFNSHNQYITTTLNHGYIGLSLLLSILFIAFFYILKTKNLELGLLLLIVIMSFFTESILERQKGVFFFGFFITLIFIEIKNRATVKVTA
ncbi:O-antigen ligase family protein [Algibacter sp. L3A6]|uniref:O-antigen ligase family protein n=1 Tax=Algibacter sp. L3A6 TaxID=2686366 RepID=UPI00131EC8BF|nr:O-antigen ligase family protein [Algibacter sp. L3A6]